MPPDHDGADDINVATLVKATLAVDILALLLLIATLGAITVRQRRFVAVQIAKTHTLIAWYQVSGSRH